MAYRAIGSGHFFCYLRSRSADKRGRTDKQCESNLYCKSLCGRRRGYGNRSKPYLAPAVEKSDYEPKTPEADASVDADTVNDATAFLETFFKLYPTATEKELAYYVSGNVIEPIGRDYLYSELVNLSLQRTGIM